MKLIYKQYNERFVGWCFFFQSKCIYFILFSLALSAQWKKNPNAPFESSVANLQNETLGNGDDAILHFARSNRTIQGFECSKNHLNFCM